MIQLPEEKSNGDAEGNFTAKATKRDFQSHIFAAFVAFVVKNDSFGFAREKSSRPQRMSAIEVEKSDSVLARNRREK
jgi:hypothetical protein